MPTSSPAIFTSVSSNRFFDKAGRFLGAGGVDVGVENLDHFMASLDVFKTGYAFIVDENGRFLYHPDKALVLKKKVGDFSGQGGFGDLTSLLTGLRDGEKTYS